VAPFIASLTKTTTKNFPEVVFLVENVNQKSQAKLSKNPSHRFKEGRKKGRGRGLPLCSMHEKADPPFRGKW
jgi:hypothetical protein